MDNIDAIFSEELLESVLEKLSSTDLKSALLVCRRWGRIGQNPNFWSWVTLKVTRNNLEEVSQVLDLYRLKSMRKLSVGVVSEKLLRAIKSHPGLEVLDLNQCNVSSAEPGFLADVISKMEDVDLEDAQVTTQQCQAIFSSINSQSKLNKLDMARNNLASVNAETLARGVMNLEVLDLSASEMTSQQCKTIFQFVASETKLVKLYIGQNDLSSVKPETFAIVVSKIEDVSLTYTNLTNQQCEKIFQFAATSQKLKALFVEDNDLSTVNPHSLAVVAAKLVQVNLCNTELTAVKCEEVFKAAANDTSVLEKLDISDNDLSFVDKEILAKSVAKLRAVDLWSTELTNEQCNIIFLHLSGDSRLKELSMSCVDLSAVDAELMALVSPKLEQAKLNYTDLTTQQIDEIFNSLTESELSTLEMAGNDFNEVDDELMALVIPKLEKADLRLSKLTTQQIDAILNSITMESKLKTLIMAEINLSSVNPTLLARVITDLEEVYFDGTSLTAEQSFAIFDRLVGDSKKLKELNMRGSDLELVDMDLIAAVSIKLKFNQVN